jgi:ABC-type multidrug transport system ATPase subunit
VSRHKRPSQRTGGESPPTGGAISAAGDAPALDARGLLKRYGDTAALGPLDVCVEAGRVVALAGHNGAGKSTLLGLAAGLLEPSGGELKVFGKRPGSIAARRLVSYVPDTATLYDDLSIAETATFVARLHGLPDAEAAVEELLARFGLEDRADHLPAQLSLGLRHRASLVVGLARPFRLLLLDEPFATLDAGSARSVAGRLEELASNGATVLVSSHQRELLPGDARCLMLRDGRLVHDGPLRDAPISAP